MKKLKQSENDEENEEELDLSEMKQGFKSFLSIGDIQLSSSKSSLKELRSEAGLLLKDKSIKKYLSYDYPKKKFQNSVLGFN